MSDEATLRAGEGSWCMCAEWEPEAGCKPGVGGAWGSGFRGGAEKAKDNKGVS